VVGQAVAVDVLDRGGVLAADLALLAQRPEQPHEQRRAVERASGNLGRFGRRPTRQAEGLARGGEVLAVEALLADGDAEPGPTQLLRASPTRSRSCRSAPTLQECIFARSSSGD
jgi:hypothetical protein